jgi:hypothetical protein
MAKNKHRWFGKHVTAKRTNADRGDTLVSVATLEMRAPLRERPTDRSEAAQGDADLAAVLHRAAVIAHREQSENGFGIVEDGDSDAEVFDLLISQAPADRVKYELIRASVIGGIAVEQQSDSARTDDGGSSTTGF